MHHLTRKPQFVIWAITGAMTCIAFGIATIGAILAISCLIDGTTPIWLSVRALLIWAGITAILIGHVVYLVRLVEDETYGADTKL